MHPSPRRRGSQTDEHAKVAAAAAVANDWFLNALDGMLAGEDPTGTSSFSCPSAQIQAVLAGKLPKLCSCDLPSFIIGPHVEE